jgi:hypothetical protein
MSEIQDEAYSEAIAEIARLKDQHEAMLLKHAKEQNISLSTLETALKQIQEQKEVIESLSDLNPTNVVDLVWILGLAAEMFAASGESTWAQRALRYKELFEKRAK